MKQQLKKILDTKQTQVTTGLFLAQIIVLLTGQGLFTSMLNPFIFLLIWGLLPVYYFRSFLRQNNEDAGKTNSKGRVTGFAIGCATILAMLWPLAHLFHEYADPYSDSDVLACVVTLYDRFAAGIYPFQPLEQYMWHPFPPYLPMYWLPVGITRFLSIDPRWAGIIMLFIATGIYGMLCWRNNATTASKLLAILFPAIGITGYLIWARYDVAVSFEFAIAAYYLILASGLVLRSFPVITLGLICCLLSRFTVVFWLPLFVILIWMNAPKKKVMLYAAAVIAAILFIYIIPFHLKDPTAFGKAMDYYKVSAIKEWEGYTYGDEKVSWSFLPGIHFAPYIRGMLSGTMEQRITVAQNIQIVLMMSLIVCGLVLYYKWEKRINMYDFSLAFLYIIMLLYFMTAPLVFKYYYLTMVMLSATMCARLILQKKSD